jgi:hypothetical protein
MPGSVILLKHTDWQVGQGENSMFAKKSLPFGIALVLLIALASLGLAYGAWTETLTINGNVTTGTFDPQFYGMGVFYEEDPADAATCTITNTPLEVTISIQNAYPGFHCEGGGTIQNYGSVPVTIHDWPEAPSTPFLTVYLHNTSMAVVPDGGSFVIPVDDPLINGYTVYGGISFDFTMPASETGSEGLDYDFTYTLQATQ